MRVKAGQQTKDALKLCYESNTPCLLSGVHGIGKSEILESVAKELGIGCIVVDLSLLESVDLVGIPAIADGRTAYNPPDFLPGEGEGLFAIEEINRAPRGTLAPALQLLSARRLHQYELPPGWLPVAACNPSDGGYHVEELDPALLSRFVRLDVVADVVEWLRWAESNQIHDAVCRYVRNTPDVFEGESNPRGWAYISRILKTHEKNGSNGDDILGVTIAGLVGDVHAAAFLRCYSQSEEPLSAEAVISDYRRYRKEVVKWAKKKRTDMLNATARNIMVALQDSDLCSNVAGDETKQRNLGDFIGDLPADLGRQLRNTARRNGAMP